VRCHSAREGLGSALLLRVTGSHPTVVTQLHCWVTLTAVTMQDKAAHGHILTVDTHINFSIEKTTERSWR
jgi:hypothetical protein